MQLVGCARARLDFDPATLLPEVDAASPAQEAGTPGTAGDAGTGHGDGDGDGGDAGKSPGIPDASLHDGGSGTDTPDAHVPPDGLEPWPDNASACPDEAPSSVEFDACIQVNLTCRYGQSYECTCYFSVWTCSD